MKTIWCPRLCFSENEWEWIGADCYNEEEHRKYCNAVKQAGEQKSHHCKTCDYYEY